MLITELTAPQLAMVTNNSTLVRSALMAAREFLTLANIVSVDAVSGSSAILAQVVGTEPVPLVSSLDGAQEVSVSDIISQITTMQQLLSLWDTPDMRALHARFIGAKNLYGRR